MGGPDGAKGVPGKAPLLGADACGVGGADRGERRASGVGGACGVPADGKQPTGSPRWHAVARVPLGSIKSTK